MDDKGFLFNYFMKMIEDKKLAQRLRDIARMRNYFSGESILEAGHKTNYVCMVVSGLVRGFYIDEEGNDRTKCFSMKGNWCCSYNYLSDIPCPFFVEAELDSVLAEFNIHDIERLKTWIPETHNYGIGITVRPQVMRVMARHRDLYTIVPASSGPRPV